MRIAYYAPMKAPDHPVPSGDREIARLLHTALSEAGMQVDLASRFRSWCADPAQAAQRRATGLALAERLLEGWRSAPSERRPQLWFTYHLYYKAPDPIGPTVAAGLRIPYVVAEASLAAKRARGPWAPAHAGCVAALAQASRIYSLTNHDRAQLDRWPFLGAKQRLLPPFLDLRNRAAPLTDATAREASRAGIASQYGLDPAQPWLIAVAMMRNDAKLESYRQLAAALAGLTDRRWQLVAVGDGEARHAVQAAFAEAGLADRLFAPGRQDGAQLARWLRSADLMVWPAWREAFGMALLEGQAAGLPAVAGASHGVPEIVADGATGLLAPPGDVAAFSAAVATLLDDPARRLALGRAARAKVEAQHSLTAAAARLRRDLANLGTGA